ncbi:MAG: ureidoglycolate lyase [Brevinematia bacterium]
MKELKYITKESFSKYGFVIDFNNPNSEGWEILTKVSKEGWRIAILEIERKAAKRLERHPDSIETFEPMSGIGVLLVASERPENFEVFLLDKPVCLNKGVWHEVFSLSERAKFKITENDEVECEYYNFKTPFGFSFDFF